MKPSNTGIPGEAIEALRWAPDGDLWVGARWPNYQEGGIGVFDRETEIWSGWANIDSPLPSEYINDIDFDANGVAWISTERGLVRLAGESWTIHDPTNSPLEDYPVYGTSIAPNGDIWINSVNAIWQFDGESSWTSYRVGQELPWEPPWVGLSSVFVASNGHVWVGNDVLPGVAEFDGTTWTLRGEELGTLAGGVEDQFGNIWLMGHPVTNPDDFFRWDGSSWTAYPLQQPTTAAFDADDGIVYLANWHGTVLRTPDGGQTMETFLTGLNIVVAFAPDSATSDIWIGTRGAVGHFTGDGVLLRDYNTSNTGSPDYWIDRNTVDRDGYLWAASGEGGLSRFDGARWRNWGSHNAGAEPYPWAGNDPMGTAFQDSAGVHWFGGNGIGRWDSAQGTFTGFWNWENNPDMWPSMFQFIAEDAAGNLFALDDVWGDVFRFNRATQLWELEPIYPYGPVGIPGMVNDSQGNVWIVAWFEIHKWDGTSWSTVELPYQDYFYDLGGINRFAIDKNDDMWFGTVQGLVHWDGTSFSLFDTSNSPLPYDQVPGVAVRDDGLVGLSSVWYGPFEGEAAAVLIAGDPSLPESWTLFHYGASPLPDYELDAVAFDAYGDFWIHTKNAGTAVLHVSTVESLQLKAAEPGRAATDNRFLVTGATPGATVHLLLGLDRAETPTPLPGCESGAISIAGFSTPYGVRVLTRGVADQEGIARLDRAVPGSVRGRRLFLQAVELQRCGVSPVLVEIFD